MTHVDELVQYCASIHTKAVYPDVIIVDDIDTYVEQLKVGFYYSLLMRCGGNIITFLWFSESVCVCVSPSHFDLVNRIGTKCYVHLHQTC